jgi:hypothetical protein
VDINAPSEPLFPARQSQVMSLREIGESMMRELQMKTKPSDAETKINWPTVSFLILFHLASVAALFELACSYHRCGPLRDR